MYFIHIEKVTIIFSICPADFYHTVTEDRSSESDIYLFIDLLVIKYRFFKLLFIFSASYNDPHLLRRGGEGRLCIIVSSEKQVQQQRE